MTKEEVIKEAWGVHYNSDVDEYGWRESNVGSSGWDINYFDIMKKDDDLYLIRPHSLNGIATNNGWIKIESEEDLPKEFCSCWVKVDGIVVNTPLNFNPYYKQFTDNQITSGWKMISHYQPIVKPKPPIY